MAEAHPIQNLKLPSSLSWFPVSLFLPFNANNYGENCLRKAKPSSFLTPPHCHQQKFDCILGKKDKDPFPKSKAWTWRASQPLELIH